VCVGPGHTKEKILVKTTIAPPISELPMFYDDLLSGDGTVIHIQLVNIILVLIFFFCNHDKAAPKHVDILDLIYMHVRLLPSARSQ
jgi:hypothetical protein